METKGKSAASPGMKIVGICRFSMLGRGDWKAFRGISEAELEAAYETQAATLFQPERMEARLASFRHLVVRSLTAQTDQDFLFYVVSSDRMPETYRDRLAAICRDVPQIRLRFEPPALISDVALEMMADDGVALADAVQFRLDDDDAVSRHFVARLRRHAHSMWHSPMFGISLSRHFYCVLDGPTRGIYNWHSPFLGTGTAVRNPRKTVFQFAHYRIPTRMLTIADPDFPNIITYNIGNDTPRHTVEYLRRRGYDPVTPEKVEAARARHFGYLDATGLALCGFDRALAEATPQPG